MPGDHHALEQLRYTLRPQLDKGQTRRGGPLGDDWLKQKWPLLLDAHYQCVVPGPSACLQDALHMITTGKFRITCPGAKRKKEEDVEEPRTLSKLDVHLVREWYDKKDKELEETRGVSHPQRARGCSPTSGRARGSSPRTPPSARARDSSPPSAWARGSSPPSTCFMSQRVNIKRINGDTLGYFF